MPSIDIKRSHDRSLADAKKSIQRVADHLVQKFGVECEWDGNTLNFERSGVDGHIKVAAKSVHVTANLGFLLMALKGPVESEIHRYLDEEFS